MKTPLTLRWLAILSIGALALVCAAPASATLYCDIKPTKDGFVALRSGPDARANLLVKMTSRDEVLLGLGEKGDWIEVTWYRGDTRLKGARGVHGWANRKLIGDMCG